MDLVDGGIKYDRVAFTLIGNCISDVVIGLKMLAQHKSVTFQFDGGKDPIVFKAVAGKTLCLAEANLGTPTLFPGFDRKIKPA